MYRSYEDPYQIQKELDEARAELEETTDEDSWIAINQDIAELEERLNHAWQDDEYDGYDDNFGMEE